MEKCYVCGLDIGQHTHAVRTERGFHHLHCHTLDGLAEVVAAPEPAPEVEGSGSVPFSALMAVEGRWTGDDRFILVDALTWDGLLPFTLTMDHDGDPEALAGWVTEIERVPGMTADERFVVGRGVLDLALPAGLAAQTILANPAAGMGVSIDIDAIKTGGVDPETVDEDAEAFWLFVVESARIRALAIVNIPAFAESLITLGELDPTTPVPAIVGPTALPADEMPAQDDDGDVIIIAAMRADEAEHYRAEVAAACAVSAIPPADWFTDPALPGPTPLTVTPEGRVFGHLALWDACHRGYPGECVRPSRSSSGYADFLLTPMRVAGPDGPERIKTGPICLAGLHASDDGRSPHEVIRRLYEDTTTAAADVRVGEDAYGPWIAGALRPGIDTDLAQREIARVSGHWRGRRGATKELIAILSVNTQGYPIITASIEGGEVTSLVASLSPQSPPTASSCACGSSGHASATDAAGAEIATIAAALRPLAAEQLARRVGPRKVEDDPRLSLARRIAAKVRAR